MEKEVFMRRLVEIACLAAIVMSCGVASGAEQKPYWFDAMKEVNANFDGNPGYVAQLGDSITYSMAFWVPIGWMEPRAYLTDDGLPKDPKSGRWRETLKGFRAKGRSNGNYSGWKVGNLLGVLDKVLAQQDPEVAIVMIGTNDMRADETYRKGLETVVEKCLAANCIPILNTIPPKRNREDMVAAINVVIKETAAKYKVPLVDFHAEVVKRRPGKTWDGTLIGKDGVHLTTPARELLGRQVAASIGKHLSRRPQ
jgi:lysophospholipase L1-like esterase